MIAAFTAANPNAESFAILMSPAVAIAMAVATNSQTLGSNGGTLFGVPVYTGQIGSRVVILDPTALLVADDGELDITISRQATVELDTAPTSPVTASAKERLRHHRRRDHQHDQESDRAGRRRPPVRALDL